MSSAIKLAAIQALFGNVMEGILSPAAFKRETGGQYHIKTGGHHDNSKWSMNELREIRKRNGVGRPPEVIRAKRLQQEAV